MSTEYQWADPTVNLFKTGDRVSTYYIHLSGKREFVTGTVEYCGLSYMSLKLDPPFNSYISGWITVAPKDVQLISH